MATADTWQQPEKWVEEKAINREPALLTVQTRVRGRSWDVFKELVWVELSKQNYKQKTYQLPVVRN